LIKISSNEIDDVISAEIFDVDVDRGLHDIVVKNMIHGACGELNENSLATFPSHLGWVKYCSNANLLFGTSAQWHTKNRSRHLTDHCKICEGIPNPLAAH